MKGEIFKFLKTKVSTEPTSVDRLIVTSYLIFNSLRINKNIFLKRHFIQETEEKEYDFVLEFLNILKSEVETFNFEVLIQLFEFVISPIDRVINGAVYTPEHIRQYIIEHSFSLSTIDKAHVRLADIACGCGGFLYDAALSIRNSTGKSYESIFRENIFGVDVTQYSIVRSKILLSLLAVTEGEDLEEFQFNLEVGNSLDFNWRERFPSVRDNNGFDIIVGNPPYVTVKKVDDISRNLLTKWEVTKSGNTDLYIAFFQVGFEALSDGGVMGYITVNSFIKSINGRQLRHYFSTQSPLFYLIDFGGEQVFKKRTTYTCICFIQNTQSNNLHYIKSNSRSLPTLNGPDFHILPYNSLDNFDGWNLLQNQVLANIIQIENTGRPLGEYLIRNGFATLANDIFVFSPIDESETHYTLKTKEGKLFPIEKGICVPAIKPSIVKTEEDLVTLEEQVIFPYKKYLQHNLDFDDNKIAEYKIDLIPERVFLENYPDTYNYLMCNEEKLARRDNGKGKYGAWYAFGRNQALTLGGAKLLFPYISDQPYFVLSRDPNLLFYNGYAIVSNNIEELSILKKILSSNIFWYYLSNISKPYAHNYFALAKNHIKKFGVCTLTDEQKNILLKLEDREEINRFLAEIYNVFIEVEEFEEA